MSAPEAAAKAGRPPRLIGLYVAGAAVLALAGAAAFYLASQKARAPMPAAVQITIAAHACKPDSLTVPAGLRTFEILNQSDRAVEWEILNGVYVVAERENIAPGIRQTVTADLQPGAYQMTCGLLNNPRGALHVTPSQESAIASASAPTMRAFLGPLAEYQFYVGRESNRFVGRAQALAEAVRLGEAGSARAAWLAAREPYEKLATVAYRFSDLVNRINPSAAYLAKRENDPAFTGFQRLAYGLFKENSVAGLAPIADQLAADAADLKARLRTLKLAPADLANGAQQLAGQLASSRIATGEDAYSNTDLDDIAANLESIGKIVALLTPVIQKAAPDAAAAADKALAEARSTLERLKKGDVYPAYETVDASTRTTLAKAFAALAQAIEKLEPAMDVRS